MATQFDELRKAHDHVLMAEITSPWKPMEEIASPASHTVYRRTPLPP